jgi:hypothetical protein
MKLFIAGGVIPDKILNKNKVNILFSFSFVYIKNFKWGGKQLFKKYTK